MLYRAAWQTAQSLLRIVAATARARRVIEYQTCCARWCCCLKCHCVLNLLGPNAPFDLVALSVELAAPGHEVLLVMPLELSDRIDAAIARDQASADGAHLCLKLER